MSNQQLETLDNVASATWGEIVELCHNQGVRVLPGLHDLMCKALRDAFEAGEKTADIVLLKKPATEITQPKHSHNTIKIEHVDNGEGESVPKISIDGNVMEPFNRSDAFLVGKSIYAATNGRPEGFDLWWSWLGWGEPARDKAERYWQRFAG